MIRDVIIEVELERKSVDIEVTVSQGGGRFPVYAGSCLVIPSAQRQTLATEKTIVMENITIEPIPSNYGLITWNGAVLTVS